MLYRFGSTTPIAQLLDASVFGVYLLCALVMVAFAVGMSLNDRIRWNDASLGALVAAFPNTGFMGVPLLAALIGPICSASVLRNCPASTSAATLASKAPWADMSGVWNMDRVNMDSHITPTDLRLKGMMFN